MASSASRSKDVVNAVEIGDVRSMGGARIRVRKGAGGEGEKERKEVAVAGGVMGGRIDEGSERLERGEGGIGVEVCGTKFTARNEQAENQLS